MPKDPIARQLLSQLESIAQRFSPPPIVRLHVPAEPCESAIAPRDAAFCAIELQDGSFGLSYLLLGDTLRQLLNQRGGAAPLAGLCPLTLARRFGSADGLERALALACVNALTDSVWRQIGFEPPRASNSLGDMQLTGSDHLGMIGFFPPLVRQVQSIGARLTVVELDQATAQRQRERFPGVTVTLDRSRLANCNVVVGTSTMLLNDTLDDMLAAAPAVSQFAVIGPSAGLWPDTLFARGVTLTGGTRISDGAQFKAAMASGTSWSTAAQKFALSSANWPGWQALLA